eukprot:2874510-Rhodomonas_salina.3
MPMVLGLMTAPADCAECDQGPAGGSGRRERARAGRKQLAHLSRVSEPQAVRSLGMKRRALGASGRGSEQAVVCELRLGPAQVVTSEAP